MPTTRTDIIEALRDYRSVCTIRVCCEACTGDRDSELVVRSTDEIYFLCHVCFKEISRQISAERNDAPKETALEVA
jgi:hypothetical protein